MGIITRLIVIIVFIAFLPLVIIQALHYAILWIVTGKDLIGTTTPINQWLCMKVLEWVKDK